MDAKVMAHRILSKMKRFSFCELTSSLVADDFGFVIGCYRNDDSMVTVVFVYSLGLKWVRQHHEYTVKYENINRVELPNGKESSSLLIYSNDAIIELPVDGRNGRFYDSLEWLRFINRVCSR